MSNLATIVSFFQSKGIPDYLIAGIVGNLSEESGFNPTDYNAGEGAIGIAQWEGGRRTALQQFAAAHGGTETDLKIQLEFLWHEMNTTEAGAWAQVQRATNVQQAAAYWDSYYERSSGSTHQDRIDRAVQFANTGELSSSNNTGGGAAPDASSGGGSGAGGALTKADYAAVDSLGNLLTSVPELRQILQKAQTQDWSIAKFENAIEDSDWYKNHSQTARSVIVQRANDPASWQQTLQNTINSINTLANQLGFDLTPDQAHHIAVSALMSGNDSNQIWLTQALGRRQDFSDTKNLGSLEGGMANTAAQLQSLAADYGFNWTPEQVAERAQNILTGKQTIDTYQARLQQWAASAFPAFRKEIMSGTTVKQLADPYVTSMSNLLEVDPGGLSAYTPMIRKAMQGTVPPDAKGNADPMATPLWKFEQQVRQDPRWATTDNAHQTMAQALLQIGSVFGFGPESG